MTVTVSPGCPVATVSATVGPRASVVIEDPVVYLPMFESYPMPTREQFEMYAEDRLENWIVEQDRGDLDIEYHWAHGSPAVEIIRFAKGNDSDLIVMGTYGRNILSRLLTGSVTQKLSQLTTCPLLTIRLPAPSPSGG